MNISFNNMGSFGLGARRSKFGFGALILFVIFGIVCLASAWGIYESTLVPSTWIHVTGHVVSAVTDNSGSNGVTYTANVSYTVAGQTYTVTDSSGSSAYPTMGSTRPVAYDPGNPSDAKVDSGATGIAFTLLMAVIGVLLIVLGPFLFVRSVKRSQDINQLKQTGTKLQGVMTDIRMTNAGRQGNSTYKIVVEAPDSTGAVRNFVSDSLVGIGGLAMANFQGQSIPMDVYISQSNPNDYYVDISEMPSLTPERIAELVKRATGGTPQGAMSVTTPAPAQAAPVDPVPVSTPAPTPPPAAPPQNQNPVG